MRPRTILGIINGNKGVGNKLTPNQRGKIEGVIAVGANFTQAAQMVDCTRQSARKTVLLTPKRHDGYSKPRSGRPKEWDARFERRVVRTVRIHPKITYA
jgi:hypothetical protein